MQVQDTDELVRKTCLESALLAVKLMEGQDAQQREALKCIFDMLQTVEHDKHSATFACTCSVTSSLCDASLFCSTAFLPLLLQRTSQWGAGSIEASDALKQCLCNPHAATFCEQSAQAAVRVVSVEGCDSAFVIAACSLLSASLRHIDQVRYLRL